MSFPSKVRDQLLVAAARHCCACHRYKGVKLEIHHIKQKKNGGGDTYENGIVLCLDCHTDAGHYNPDHPKGSKFSPSELKLHKEKWFKTVIENSIPVKKESEIKVVFDNNEEILIIRPEFSEIHREYRNIEELKKVDYKSLMSDTTSAGHFGAYINWKIKSFESFVDFMNGELFKDIKEKNPDKENNPQPILYDFSVNGNISKFRNLSVGEFKLKIVNDGTDSIEDPKLRVFTSNLTNAQPVDPRRDFFDQTSTSNIQFESGECAVFQPNTPSILHSGDYLEIDSICFKPDPTKTEVIITWEFYSRSSYKSGEIKIQVSPILNHEISSKYVADP